MEGQLPPLSQEGIKIDIFEAFNILANLSCCLHHISSIGREEEQKENEKRCLVKYLQMSQQRILRGNTRGKEHGSIIEIKDRESLF